MIISRNSCSRLVYPLALVAAFLAGFYLHGTSLPSQSQEYLQSLLHQPDSYGPVHSIEVTLNTPIDTASATSSDTSLQSSPNADDPGYSHDRLLFQSELHLDLPNFDIAKLRNLAPRNYKGPGHEAFASFYLSRNASLQDPYFLATLQVVYRLLWDPISRSNQHPVVVFVAPFVTDEQRSYFEASGAIVREVASRPFAPNELTQSPVAERLKDVFSKLEMWNQTDFSRIAYLDSDAFPLINIDLLFSEEVVPTQTCNKALLSDEDQKDADSLCNYSFGAVRENSRMMNAGVMVLQPNEAMYSVLLREYHDGRNFDNGFVEQALLTYVFRQDGPFPPTVLPEAWNGTPKVRDDGRALFILHAKIWVLLFKVDHWASSIWEDTWNDLVQLYEEPVFAQIRAHDESRAHPQHKETDINKWHLDD